MKSSLLLSLLFLAPSALFAASSPHASETAMKDGSNVSMAVAVITPTKGNDVKGIVTFTAVEDGVRVAGRIENLSPGAHGFHVHHYGDLRKPDGTSAGGHFNPTDKPHAGPDSKMRHVGDLGNIVANEEGVAVFTFTDDHIQLHGPTSILGRGLILHAGEDDLETQPTGAAGPRVGMAVIGVANPGD